ncbi:Hamartin protein-domain-containing protein [Endogone sp. FLAS-F59071]|nr:Hamartin protein-domain-containing protein [Endogone sp. FLAS-F59071]|eukprot:RUS22198.1 Hamartin protein-domain-containing protein [Endogone sp. FLAS-F59071]
MMKLACGGGIYAPPLFFSLSPSDCFSYSIGMWSKMSGHNAWRRSGLRAFKYFVTVTGATSSYGHPIQRTLPDKGLPKQQRCSMVSTKDIIKAITAYLKDSSAQNDGTSILNLIESYVDEQQRANPDQDSPSTLDKLSAELSTLYQQELQLNGLLELVSGKPTVTLVHAKHLLFLCVLHKLIPVLTPARLISEWWNLAFRPVLASSRYTHEIVLECRRIVLDMITGEDQAGIDFRNTIVELFLDRKNKLRPKAEGVTGERAQSENEKISAESRVTAQQQEVGTTTMYSHLLENDWHRNLGNILHNLGGVKPKDFFILLNTYYIQSQYRLHILYLLSEFIRRKRTHIHDMLETPLFENILKSLMLDNSTTLIAVSVTTLIMLLPRICTSIPDFLPHLFYIFARAICWDQLRDCKDARRFERDLSEKNDTEVEPAEGNGQLKEGSVPKRNFVVDGWDCLDYSISKLPTPPSNPRTGPLFTCLYGLYPCNFIAFLHSPLDYLDKSDFKLPEDFDAMTFRNRTMPILNRHVLHPNLVLMDAATELSDTSRWMKVEPPDVLAQCMSLDLTNVASRAAYDADGVGGQECKDIIKDWTEAGMKEVESEDEGEGEGGEGESEREANVEKGEEGERDSARGEGKVTMEEIIAIHMALKSGAEIVAGDDAWESRMTTAVTTATTTTTILPHIPTAAATDSVADRDRALIASLEREVLLLRNELNFELFLRQQHLQHIGRLHVEHVKDISNNANKEQLLMTIMTHRDSLKSLQAKYDQQVKEAACIKEKHVKWEDRLNENLRKYREEKKEWSYELEGVREKLEETKVSGYSRGDSRGGVCAAGGSAEQRWIFIVFSLENELKIIQPKVDKITESEQRVDQLTKSLMVWQDDTNRFQEQTRQMEALLSQWRGMELKLAASEEQIMKLSGMLT